MAWAQFSKDPQWASEDEKAAYFRDRTRATRKGELIEQARSMDPTVETILAALEAFYGHGVTDEVSGNVDAPVGHFYRVDRWIVVTDDRGFHEVWNFGTIEEAKKEFQILDEKFSEWDGGD